MQAWIYIKVKGNEVLHFGPIYGMREVIDEMLADVAYENGGDIHAAGDTAIKNVREARTLEGKQFKGFRGYIRTINV